MKRSITLRSRKSLLQRRIEATRQKGFLLLARNMPAAVAKLVELIESGEGEIARKACVDLLKLQVIQPHAELAEETVEDGDGLSPELADRLLKALAGEALGVLDK